MPFEPAIEAALKVQLPCPGLLNHAAQIPAGRGDLTRAVFLEDEGKSHNLGPRAGLDADRCHRPSHFFQARGRIDLPQPDFEDLPPFELTRHQCGLPSGQSSQARRSRSGSSRKLPTGQLAKQMHALVPRTTPPNRANTLQSKESQGIDDASASSLLFAQSRDRSPS